MHELGMCEAIVDALRQRAGGRRVEWARVRVGGHAVDPAVIAHGVALAASGTEAEGVELELIVDPMRARCRRCGAEEPVTNALALAACVHCGGVDVDIAGSEHASLEALRYQTQGRAAT
jgi:hydrogenase nickel incorporation protein HypA/HybF